MNTSSASQSPQSKLLVVCIDCGLEQLDIHARECHACDSKFVKLVDTSRTTVSHIDLEEAAENFKKLSKKMRGSLTGAIIKDKLKQLTGHFKK